MQCRGERTLPAEIITRRRDRYVLTIRIKFKKFKDSPSHIEVNHSVVPTFPSKKKGFIANRDLVGNLSADPEDLGITTIPATRQKNLSMAGKDND